jgi:hypothetical protein
MYCFFIGHSAADQPNNLARPVPVREVRFASGGGFPLHLMHATRNAPPGTRQTWQKVNPNHQDARQRENVHKLVVT